MGLILRDKFAASKTPYAFDPESLETTLLSTKISKRILVHGLWAGRKNGLTTVSLGYLWSYQKYDEKQENLDSFTASVDMRYGGAAVAKWDGVKFWTDSSVTEEERPELLEQAKSALETFPEVPFGYQGWYYRD